MPSQNDATPAGSASATQASSRSVTPVRSAASAFPPTVASPVVPQQAPTLTQSRGPSLLSKERQHPDADMENLSASLQATKLGTAVPPAQSARPTRMSAAQATQPLEPATPVKPLFVPALNVTAPSPVNEKQQSALFETDSTVIDHQPQNSMQEMDLESAEDAWNLDEDLNISAPPSPAVQRTQPAAVKRESPVPFKIGNMAPASSSAQVSASSTDTADVGIDSDSANTWDIPEVGTEADAWGLDDDLLPEESVPQPDILSQPASHEGSALHTAVEPGLQYSPSIRAGVPPIKQEVVDEPVSNQQAQPASSTSHSVGIYGGIHVKEEETDEVFPSSRPYVPPVLSSDPELEPKMEESESLSPNPQAMRVYEHDHTAKQEVGNSMGKTQESSTEKPTWVPSSLGALEIQDGAHTSFPIAEQEFERRYIADGDLETETEMLQGPYEQATGANEDGSKMQSGKSNLS